jgi:hypothetical protein
VIRVPRLTDRENQVLGLAAVIEVIGLGSPNAVESRSDSGVELKELIKVLLATT